MSSSDYTSNIQYIISGKDIFFYMKRPVYMIRIKQCYVFFLLRVR